MLHSTTPPNNFCQAVLRLAVILMQALGQQSFSLEFVTSAEAIGPSADRLEAVLCHLLIPLFIRVSSQPKETSVIQAKDLSTCLTNMQNSVSPPLGKQSVAPLMSTSTLATTFIRGTQVHGTPFPYSALNFKFQIFPRGKDLFLLLIEATPPLSQRTELYEKVSARVSTLLWKSWCYVLENCWLQCGPGWQDLWKIFLPRNQESLVPSHL